jgi:uncharacterized protein YjdB
MNRFLYRTIFVFGALLTLAACADGPERDIEYTIYTTNSTIELLEGEEYQIEASPTEQTFSWETTNPAVATVSTTGLVRAISDGTCFIHIISSEGLSRSIPVDVEKLLQLEGIDVFNKANLASVDAVSVLLGQTIELAANAMPSNYNERVSFNLVWESSDNEIATVDASGIIKPVDYGNATVTITVADKPSVKKVISVEILEKPITSIQVESALDLMLNKKYTVTPVRLPLDYGVKDATLVWRSSDESVVKVTDGEIDPVGNGSAVVTVSLNSNPSVYSEIAINVANMVIRNFTDAGSNLVQGNVYLEKDKEIVIMGVDPSTYAAAYNRDFMAYDAATGKLTFIGETGYWDVFYSSKYNYFWVARMSDVAPACHWIIGNGFACPPVWHGDFSDDGWSTGNMRQMAYMRLLGDGKYQATISIDAAFDFVTFANRAWGGQLYDYTLIAPPGIGLHPNNNSDVINVEGFVPGYYRFTYDRPNMTYIFEKVD